MADPWIDLDSGPSSNMGRAKVDIQIMRED